MSSIPVMWSVWGALFLVFVAFRVYVYNIRRNEDDQLVLHDSSAHLRQEQETITARLQSTKPVGTAILGLLGAMTLFVLGYYVMDVVRQFR